MSNHSVIEHRACYHFIKAEEDYIAICSQGKRAPHCKALILAILENWANIKGKDTYIYMSFPQWIRATYMFYERNVLVDCLQELLEEKMIDRRSIVMNDQKTFEYKINVSVVQALIKQLPAKENEYLPNLDNYLAFKERGKAERAAKKEQQGGVVEKSHTPKKGKRVVEKSHTPSEKSHTVVEKSTADEQGGYVKNQRNIDSNYIDTNIDKNIDVINGTASADASTTSRNPLSEKNEEEKTTPPPTSQEQQPEKPASQGNAPRRSSASGKSKQSKKDEIEQMLKLSEIAAPKKPDPTTHAYNVELFMELGDYYRGCQLPKSNQPNSRYQKALKSSMNYVQRKTPFSQVDMVYCYLLGRGEEIGLPELRDQKWIDGGYNTDLWTIEPNHASKWNECQKAKQQILAARGRTAQPTSNPTPGMDHDEAVQLATDIVTQGKEHGYDIQATAASSKTGSWLVRVIWGDEGKLTIKSRSHWQTEFAEIHSMYVAEQQKKGVN